MDGPDLGIKSEQRKMVFQKNGRTYFTKRAERMFYFVMTLIMLAVGVLTKCRLF